MTSTEPAPSPAWCDDPTREVVVVTGSGGRVGVAVLNDIAHEFRCVAFDRDAQPQPRPEVECVLLDVTKPDSIDLAMRRLRYAYGTRIASVVHLAAYHDFTGEPSPLYEEVTVRGTERLLHALRDFEVEQFLFSSSLLVHRPTEPGERIDEDSPLEAHWSYPQSKIDTEEVLRKERGDVPVVALRIAGVYTEHCDSIPLAAQIERILSDPIQGRVFPGDPNHGQPFVHMDDTVDAIRRCIERRHQLPKDMVPILIGETTTYSYAQLQSEFARHLLGKPDWPSMPIPPGLAKAVTWLQDKLPFTEPLVKPWMIDRADDHFELDISRARRLLDWQPKHDLLQSIPRMIEVLAQDPESWARRNGIELSDSAQERVAEEHR